MRSNYLYTGTHDELIYTLYSAVQFDPNESHYTLCICLMFFSPTVNADNLVGWVLSKVNVLGGCLRHFAVTYVNRDWSKSNIYLFKWGWKPSLCFDMITGDLFRGFCYVSKVIDSKNKKDVIVQKINKLIEGLSWNYFRYVFKNFVNITLLTITICFQELNCEVLMLFLFSTPKRKQIT